MDLSGLPDNTLDPGLDLGGLPDSNARVLREQYRTTTGTPDEAARVIDLADRTGLPRPVVERNRPEVERKASEPDWGDLEVTAPITVRELAANTRMFALAHDDTENLRQIERTMGRRSAGLIGGPAFDRSRGTMQASTGPEASFSSIAYGLADSFAQGAERERQGARLQFADAFGFDEMGRDALRRRGQAQFTDDLSTPEFDTATARGLYAGGASTLRNLPGLAASILARSPLPGLTAAGVQTELDAYGKYRARGATGGEALLGAAGEGAVEVATELIPLRTMLGAFGQPGKTFAKEFLKSQVQEQFGEQAATVLQDAIDTAIANPTKTWGDYLKERPDAAYQTFLATLVQSGVMTAGHVAVARMAGAEAQAAGAAKDAEALAQLSQLAAASKLRARDPQTFQDFVAAANEDGPVPDVYLDARTLQQAGIDVQALAQASPAVAAQIEEALATGGDLVVPTAEYAARIAGTDLDAVLTPHLRTAEDALSLDEAQRFYQGQADEFKQAATQVMQERAEDAAWQQSAKAVEARLFDELKSTSRFTDDVNTAYSTLMRDFYVATASRLGITPEETFSRYPIRVAAERMAGDARRMDQPGSTPPSFMQRVLTAIGMQQPEAPPQAAGPTLDMGQFFRGDVYNQGKKVQRDENTLDLFADPRAADAGQSAQSAIPGDVQPTADLPRGNFATRTELEAEGDRKLGASRVTTVGEAARAVAYLGRGAVERFDALITDKQGKPLAIVGSTKGEIGQTSVFPSTIVGEAFRVPGAANIWFAHNHPSGKAEFSAADRNMGRILSEAFRGSAIEPKGFFAIASEKDGARRWVHLHENNYDDTRGVIPESKVEATTVPVMQRVFVATGKLAEPITAPSDAKRLAATLSGGESGLLLTDYQNQPIAFVPVAPAATMPLRDTGGMDALYRALSVANAGAAFVVNHDGAYSLDQVRNLTALLSSVNVRALDVMHVAADGTVKSGAEMGLSFQGSSFSQNERGEIAFGRDITQTPSVITLFNNADLSTFLHEMGHFQLEVLANIASRPDAPAEIVADFNAALKWFGVPDLAAWRAMSLKEKGPYHEQFARGFEAYLFEGKAPSQELTGLFARFRSWLINVYKSIKALNVEISDDIRQVFDRLVATDEAIKQAEAARAMTPIFPDDPEVRAAAAEATQTAIATLQRRSLRDMRWLTNARGRLLKQMQRDANEKRREVRRDIAREVWSQPVYQAWQFLTSRETLDPVGTKSAPKPTTEGVDPAIDSLLVALAKIGGINREDAREQLGLHPDDFHTDVGLFGKRPFRKSGGLSVEHAIERLRVEGYLADENDEGVDTYDTMRDLEDKIADELGGHRHYSNRVDYDALQGPAAPTAEGVAQRPGGRLNTDQVRAIAGADAAKLERLRMTRQGALDPDLVAEMINQITRQNAFTSGDHLVRSLLAAERPSDLIEALTDRRVLERYGDLAHPDTLARAVDEAIHNEMRLKVLAAELRAATQAVAPVRAILQAAKAFAEGTLARRKLKDIRPRQHATAETRAGKAALRAFGKGDTAALATEKRTQLVQGYLTKLSYDALDEVANARAFFGRVVTGGDETVVKTRDLDVVNAARAILAAYGFRRQAKTAAEYLKAVEAYDPEMYAVLKDRVDSAVASAKPFNELTLEEMRGLRDEIDAMWYLAKRNRQMEVDGELLDRQEVQAALRERMDAIGVPDEAPGDKGAITPAEERLRKLQTLRAAARRVESWAEAKDGADRTGPFWRYVWNTIKDPANRYRTEKAAALKALREAFDAIPGMQRGLIDAPELGYTFGKDEGGVGMSELMHALLHVGNESNKRKLLLGRRWATENADGTLDTSWWDAFIARMHQEGRITKAHYDARQQVWDILESLKPAAQKAHRDVFGYYFKEVTAEPQATPFGTYRGGYVPAMADTRIVNDASLRKLAEQENESMAFAFPATSKGFTKSRVDYNRPLLLDLRTLAQHVDKVLLFAHLEQPVRDVRRVLLAPEVAQALTRIDPAAYDGLLIPWLNRAARQQVEAPIPGDRGLMRIVSVARQRAGMAAMFANVSNTAQQITGFSLAAVKVAPRHLLGAAGEYVKAPKAMAQAVAEASPYMATRMENEVAQMIDGINDILLDPTLYQQAQAWTAKHAYFMQSAIDNVMSPIVWTAAYNEALEGGASELDARRLADGAVRQTQGTTQPEDISRIETGNAFWRLFAQFAGYFNMQANVLGTRYAQTAEELGVRKGAGRMLYITLFGFLAPAWVAEAIAQMFRGGPDDEDKDGEYLDDWLMAVFGFGTLRTATAMIPVAGQAVNAAVNAVNTKPYDDRIATAPAVSMIESAVRAPSSVYKAIVEDASKQKAVRDVATLITLTTGLPAGTLARPIGYGAGVAANEIKPENEADFARGLISGAKGNQR